MFLSWKRMKTIHLLALKSYGWWVSCDYNVSSAPFVSELRLWEWNLEIWAEMSRSWAWQWTISIGFCEPSANSNGLPLMNNINSAGNFSCILMVHSHLHQSHTTFILRIFLLSFRTFSDGSGCITHSFQWISAKFQFRWFFLHQTIRFWFIILVETILIFTILKDF